MVTQIYIFLANYLKTCKTMENTPEIYIFLAQTFLVPHAWGMQVMWKMPGCPHKLHKLLFFFLIKKKKLIS